MMPTLCHHCHAISDTIITKMSLPKNTGDIGGESTRQSALPFRARKGDAWVRSSPAKLFGKKGVTKFNKFRDTLLFPAIGKSAVKN
jgi:hypothetical protein